jgi:hypothetical protein
VIIVMMRFEHCFDTVFDDVFQREQEARLFYDGRVVSEQDLSVRFALSLITGQTVVLPASLLLDHSPLRRLLFTTDKWPELIFDKGLMRVGLYTPSWDNLIREMGGGTVTKKPLYWTTSDSNTQKVHEVWQKDGPEAAFEEFRRLFPQILDEVEVLKEYAKFVDVGEYPSYQPFLLDALSNIPAKATYSSEWKNAKKQIALSQNRTDAYIVLDSLATQSSLSLEEIDELRRVSIEAKHIQLARWLKASNLRQIPRKEILDSSKVIKQFNVIKVWEVPFIGSLLNGDVNVHALLELANEKHFVRLREDFLQARHAGDTNGAQEALHKLCWVAADVLGITQDKDGTIKVIKVSKEFLKLLFYGLSGWWLSQVGLDT